MKFIKLGRWHFNEDMPQEVFEGIKATLFEMEWMIPSWCQFVNVHFSVFHAEKSNATLEVRCHYEYRWAALTFYSMWLDGDADQRLEDVTHELLHVLRSPADEFMADILKEMLGDGSEDRILRKDLADRIEMSIQDMTYVFLGLVRVRRAIMEKEELKEIMRRPSKIGRSTGGIRDPGSGSRIEDAK